VRTMYRCRMCHKHCFIPCRLNISQFKELESGTGEVFDDELNDGEVYMIEPNF
jgi:hypothetical protein